MSGGGGAAQQKPTPMEVELSKIAEDKWTRFQDVFAPAENKFIDKAKQMGSESERSRTAGAGVSAVQDAVGTGGGLKRILGRETARTSGLTTAMTKADEITGKRKNAGTEAVIALGQNIENTGLQGMSRVAGQQNVMSAAKADVDASRNDMFSEAAGMGLGYGLSRPNTNSVDPYTDRRSMTSASVYDDYPVA